MPICLQVAPVDLLLASLLRISETRNLFLMLGIPSRQQRWCHHPIILLLPKSTQKESWTAAPQVRLLSHPLTHHHHLCRRSPQSQKLPPLPLLPRRKTGGWPLLSAHLPSSLGLRFLWDLLPLETPSISWTLQHRESLPDWYQRPLADMSLFDRLPLRLLHFLIPSQPQQLPPLIWPPPPCLLLQRQSGRPGRREYPLTVLPLELETSRIPVAIRPVIFER